MLYFNTNVGATLARRADRRATSPTSSSTASTSSTAVSCEAKGLAYKFARFWALPSVASQKPQEATNTGRGAPFPAGQTAECPLRASGRKVPFRPKADYRSWAF